MESDTHQQYSTGLMITKLREVDSRDTVYQVIDLDVIRKLLITWHISPVTRCSQVISSTAAVEHYLSFLTQYGPELVIQYCYHRRFS